MTQSSWGAIIVGEAFDLEDWADTLKPPFDPWVEIQGANTVLRSTSFDELTSGEQVHTRALALIERLNGALAVLHKAKPISFDGLVEITSSGQPLVIKFAQFVAEGRSKVRAVGQVIGPNDKPIASPPAQASEVQRWCELVERHELLDDALTYFAKPNWFDIYKALECLFLRVGGEESFLALGWESKDEVLRLKRIANWARHSRHKFEPPPDPMPIKEARELLGRLIQRALRET